jgi:hypothetical protein
MSEKSAGSLSIDANDAVCAMNAPRKTKLAIVYAMFDIELDPACRTKSWFSKTIHPNAAVQAPAKELPSTTMSFATP